MTNPGSQNPGSGVCTATGLPVPHTSKTYDGGLQGLSVARYNNQNLAGTPAGSGTHSVAYCYDNADRLTGTTVSNPVSGATAVFSQALSVSGNSPTIAYDAHGNTTTLADETIAYDSTDRHVGTTLTDGTSVIYVRDVADRIVNETTTAGGVMTTVRYGYTGSDDAPDFCAMRIWARGMLGRGRVF